jgi:hypothetical protein
MLGKYISYVLFAVLLIGITACGSAQNSESPVPAAELQGAESRFAVINETLNWNEAKIACEASGGHLATITSRAEQDEIVKLLASLEDDKKRNSYFLGGIDTEKNGIYTWVTGENFDYSYWKKNEPKPDKGEQYLAIFAKTYEGNSGTTEPGRWNDTMLDGTAYSGAGDTGFFAPEQTGYIIEWDK